MKKRTQSKGEPWSNGAVSEPTSREQILHNLPCLFPFSFTEAYCVAALGVCVLFY